MCVAAVLVRIFAALLALLAASAHSRALPTPFPTGAPTPAPTPTPVNATSITTTTPAPSTVPAGCPASASAWLRQTPSQVAALATDCFADLSAADTAQLVALQCGALTAPQLAALSSGCGGFYADCLGALSVSARSAAAASSSCPQPR